MSLISPILSYRKSRLDGYHICICSKLDAWSGTAQSMPPTAVKYMGSVLRTGTAQSMPPTAVKYMGSVLRTKKIAVERNGKPV